MSTGAEELKKLKNSEAYNKLKSIYPDVSFDKEIEDNPALVEHIRSVLNS